jgi:ATP-dependent DNA helicase RecQ
VQLLNYFGESSSPCGNCDNCLHPPAVWDASDAARKMLSCIYRVQQHSGIGFGAGQIMDILRGKATEKVAQFGHDTLSTFGIGAELSEQQWRGVLRQLIAIGAVRVDVDAYNTLQLTDLARPVLRSEVRLMLRESLAEPRRSAGRKPAAAKASAEAAQLDAQGLQRLAALKAWRGEVAREHNLPAYVIFHDSTLIALAQAAPQTLGELDGISGMGVKKLQAYGSEVLRVMASA